MFRFSTSTCGLCFAVASGTLYVYDQKGEAGRKERALQQGRAPGRPTPAQAGARWVSAWGPGGGLCRSCRAVLVPGPAVGQAGGSCAAREPRWGAAEATECSGGAGLGAGVDGTRRPDSSLPAAPGGAVLAPRPGPGPSLRPQAQLRLLRPVSLAPSEGPPSLMGRAWGRADPTLPSRSLRGHRSQAGGCEVVPLGVGVTGRAGVCHQHLLPPCLARTLHPACPWLPPAARFSPRVSGALGIPRAAAPRRTGAQCRNRREERASGLNSLNPRALGAAAAPAT